MRLFRRKRHRTAPRVEPGLCGAKGWRSWMLCDLPADHTGDHGTVTSRQVYKGILIDSTSVTREMWT